MKTETFEIRGVTYKIKQFGAIQGRKVLLRLTHFIGPALASYASGDVAGAFAYLDEKDLDFICDALASCSWIVNHATTDKGPRDIDVPLSAAFDSHFSGRYMPMLEWLAAGIKLNFEDFFSEAAKLQSENSAAQKPSPVPQASIGSSGDS